MKKISSSLLVIFAAISLNSTFAQNEGNVFHVQTLKFVMPQGGSMAEFDSLTALMTKNVTMKQDRVLSQRFLRHLWGSSNRQLVVISEYKNVQDAVADRTDEEELFNAAWKTQADRDAFNKAYNKYWSMEHGDEIYQEMPSGRKN